MSAQRKADVVVPFNDNIESIVLNQSTGSIIVKDKNQISSYDPEYNTFEWQIKEEDLIKSSMLENGVKADQMMKALENSDFDQILDKKKDEITFISNSPFIRITFDKADVIIIHSMDKLPLIRSMPDIVLFNLNICPAKKHFL